MTDLIHVEPTPETRIALARWAVAQTPKVSTVGPNTFGIPAHLFSSVPEAALIGAQVDGHRYVSPDEEASVPAEEGTAETELTGVARPEGFTVSTPDEAPAVPEESSSAESTPLAAAESDTQQEAPASESGPETEDGADYPCEFCPRSFSTERGRTTHVRRSHPEQEL
ncbi:C2H2-type zinc finger protein [Streptomyces kronopolitis]|uniref:C2H2-type zinc finger protein n=1 Tax=Streptomyces kronopolitis TaxID=1612435 RepID=UPI003D97E035